MRCPTARCSGRRLRAAAERVIVVGQTRMLAGQVLTLVLVGMVDASPDAAVDPKVHPPLDTRNDLEPDVGPFFPTKLQFDELRRDLFPLDDVVPLLMVTTTGDCFTPMRSVMFERREPGTRATIVLRQYETNPGCAIRSDRSQRLGSGNRTSRAAATRADSAVVHHRVQLFKADLDAGVADAVMNVWSRMFDRIRPPPKDLIIHDGTSYHLAYWARAALAHSPPPKSFAADLVAIGDLLATLAVARPEDRDSIRKRIIDAAGSLAASLRAVGN